MPPREQNPDDARDEWSDDRDSDGHEKDSSGSEPDPQDFELADEERFSGDTAFCPDCGAKVYDDADVCPACFTWLNGETARHPPDVHRRRQQGRGLVVILIIAGLLSGLVAWMLGALP